MSEEVRGTIISGPATLVGHLYFDGRGPQQISTDPGCSDHEIYGETDLEIAAKAEAAVAAIRGDRPADLPSEWPHADKWELRIRTI